MFPFCVCELSKLVKLSFNDWLYLSEWTENVAHIWTNIKRLRCSFGFSRSKITQKYHWKAKSEIHVWVVQMVEFLAESPPRCHVDNGSWSVKNSSCCSYWITRTFSLKTMILDCCSIWSNWFCFPQSMLFIIRCLTVFQTRRYVFSQ